MFNTEKVILQENIRIVPRFLKYELTLRENVGLGELSKLYSDESYNTSFFTTSWDSENELRLEDIYIRYSDGKFHFTTIDESIKRD